MEIRVSVSESVKRLLDKGVKIVNPLMVEIADEIDPERISGDGVILYPGTRLYGEKTAILAGAVLGYEGPVIVEDCRIGPRVQLKGGYFKKATFLDRASLALGAHVREGCLLEEEANGAHTVGLKQTILFPFVTLGSLVNFCDCFMAGGTSRKDHSEVGSSYIHFNFTPEADKTTASLLGDVPRGVMLRRPPIFLGGQGGIVGPVQMGYGAVVAAGSVVRHDVAGDNRLVVEAISHSLNREFVPRRYPSLVRVVNTNVRYVANLLALEQWYRHARQQFFARQPLGLLLLEGALENLDLAKKERCKRLKEMAEKMPEAIGAAHDDAQEIDTLRKKDFHQNIDALLEILTAGREKQAGAQLREKFLPSLAAAGNEKDSDYISVIQGLSDEAVTTGTAWLQAIVDNIENATWRLLPRFTPDKSAQQR